jgi:G8 domain
MVRERGATFAAHKQAKAINWVTATVLLIGTFLFAAPVLAQQVETCPTGRLNDRPGGGDFTHPPDLLIDHECHVGIGWFSYNNVNIISGPGNRTHGKLIFVEDRDGTSIQFYAHSILVENGGSLEAGTADKPFGSRGDISPSMFTVRTRALVEQA